MYHGATPTIGITSQVVRDAKWYKFIGDLGFEAVEINRLHSKLHFNMYFLEKIKKYMKSFNLSLHSGTNGIFQPVENFTNVNLATLTAEIDICRYLGARQLVFHMTDGFLTPENKKRFQQVIDYAQSQSVDLLYESNSNLIAAYAYQILDAFPQLNYVLDLGHLNHGHGTGKLGCSINEFLDRIKNRITYIHASNNSGRQDEHLPLDQGTLNWRQILATLDLTKIQKIIVEVRNLDMVEDCRQSLLNYLKGDLGSPHVYAVGAGM